MNREAASANAGLSILTILWRFVLARWSQYRLSRLALKITPHHDWHDVGLPDETVHQLKELCTQIADRQVITEKWGLKWKSLTGECITALFTGSPTTMLAAEVIAKDLGIDLYRVDLATVVSKYIGETEKNLERIFVAADDANAILFFDEADALFGKTSISDSAGGNDLSIGTAYLMRNIEQIHSILIFAAHHPQNLDDPFVKKMTFIVRFPSPVLPR